MYFRHLGNQSAYKNTKNKRAVNLFYCSFYFLRNELPVAPTCYNSSLRRTKHPQNAAIPVRRTWRGLFIPVSGNLLTRGGCPWILFILSFCKFRGRLLMLQHSPLLIDYCTTLSIASSEVIVLPVKASVMMHWK
jgi:hypothetical protein